MPNMPNKVITKYIFLAYTNFNNYTCTCALVGNINTCVIEKLRVNSTVLITCILNEIQGYKQ